MRLPAIRLARNTILLLAGLSGLFYETVLTKGERPTLIAAFCALCGLPAFLRADEKAKEPSTVAVREDRPLTEQEIGRALMRLAVEEQQRADERKREQ